MRVYSSAACFLLVVFCTQIPLISQEKDAESQVDIEILGYQSPAPDIVTLFKADEPKKKYRGVLLARDDKKASFRFKSFPVSDLAWRVTVRISDNKRSSNGNSILLKLGPEVASVTLEQVTEEQTGLIVLQAVNATDATGNDLSKEVFIDDPETAPLLDELGQLKGQDILKKLGESNQYWVSTDLPEGMESISYDYIFVDKIRHTFPSKFKSENPLYARRGVALETKFDHLVKSPQEVLFRRIEEHEGEIIVFYTLLNDATQNTRSGMNGYYNSWISENITSGCLIIDSKKMLPIEHQTRGSSMNNTEKYSDFVEIKPGKFVPLQIAKPEMKFTGEFQVVEPGLWILKSGNVMRDRFKVENVQVVTSPKP